MPYEYSEDFQIEQTAIDLFSVAVGHQKVRTSGESNLWIYYCKL